MSTRRDILKGFAALPAAARVSTATTALSFLAPRPARAWVMVAIAVVQTAIQVGKMLGPKGPSPMELMSLQTEILLNLSKQIGVLHQKIDLVMEQLQELTRLVEGIPVEVVKEIYKTDLNAKLGIFQLKMKSFADALREKSEAQAREELTDLKQVVYSAHEFLTVFSQEEKRNAGVIPLMAAAMQAEITSMILLEGEGFSDITIRNAAEEYARWFRYWLDPQNPSNIPKQCRALVSDMLIDKRRSDALFLKYQGWMCFRNVQAVYESPGPVSFSFDVFQLDITHEFPEVFLSDDKRTFSDWVRELRSQGAVLPEPLEQIAHRDARLYPPVKVENLTVEALKMEMVKTMQRQREASAICEGASTTPESVLAEYAQIESRYKLNHEKLLALFSFLLIAAHSRTACDRFYSYVADRRG